jgi:hypothetical protein
MQSNERHWGNCKKDHLRNFLLSLASIYGLNNVRAGTTAYDEQGNVIKDEVPIFLNVKAIPL